MDQTGGVDGEPGGRVVRGASGAGAGRAAAKLTVAHLSCVVDARNGDRRTIVDDVSLAVPSLVVVGSLFTVAQQVRRLGEAAAA